MGSNIFLKLLRPSLYSFFLINLIFLSPHQSALAQENIRIIDAGVPADFPPQYSIDKKTGEPVGFAIDIMNEVAKRRGLKVRYRVFDTWSKTFKALKEKRVHLIPNVGITDERKSYCDFTIPVEAFHISIFVRSSATDINGVNDLTGRTVAVVEANKALFILKKRPGVKLQIHASLEQALMSLLSGNADAVAYPEPVFKRIIRRSGIENRIKTVGEPLLEVKRGIAVQKGLKGLHEKLNDSIDDFIGTPEYKKIYAKWYSKPKPFWNVIKVIIAMGILLVLTITSLMVWRYWTVLNLNNALIKSNTDLKRAEKTLRESEERQRQIIENSNAGYFLIDREGRFQKVNPAWLRLHKYDTAEEIIGRHFSLTQAEVDMPDAHDIVEHLLGGKEIITGEFSRRCKDGSIGYHTFSARPVQKEGVIIGLEGFLIDITEKKKLESQLIDSHKMQAIATLAGGIAHQFNNALSPVSVNLDMLDLDSERDARITKYTAPIKESVHRLADLTSQLLAYARGGKYSTQTISLNDFVRKTLPVIEASIKSEASIETDLPESIRAIEADPIQIEMALSAVLENASESIEGEGHIRIIIENEEINEEFARNHADLKVGPYVCIRIEDNGKGMDEETLRRIFEPFFTTKFQGRGLGLAAAYGVIKNHGGLITIDSEPAKGTTARIYLPAIEDADAWPLGMPADQIEREAPFKRWTEVSKGTGTILVIEDEELVMYAAKMALEKLGYHVLEARTGKEAVDIVKTHEGDIDLAILDMKLPDMSGEKVYPSIQEARPEMKVIICSGYALDESIRGLLDRGARGFIEKPFDLTTLAEKLKEVLDPGPSTF